MKLKYYMRGLGIGIVVTALLMGFAIPKQKEPMTDAEIKQRALELGMIAQDGVLADDLGDHTSEESDALISDNDIETAVDENISDESETDPVATEDSIIEDSTTEDSTIEEVVTVAEIAVITVSGGDGSRTVANKLQEAGLIEDAAAYDAYLCQNGYDKRIATGDHEIPMGASEEEIAKEITTRKN